MGIYLWFDRAIRETRPNCLYPTNFFEMEPLRSEQEQYLRDLLKQHEFAFDEQAWEAMEALLSESPNRAGGRYGWLAVWVAIWVALLLLLGQGRLLLREQLRPQPTVSGPIAEASERRLTDPRPVALPVVVSESKRSEDATDSEKEPFTKRTSTLKKANASAHSAPREVKGMAETPLEEPSSERSARVLSAPEHLDEEWPAHHGTHEVQISDVNGVHPAETSAGLAQRYRPRPLPITGLEEVPIPRSSNPLPLAQVEMPKAPRIEHGLTVGLGVSALQQQPSAVAPALALGYLFRHRLGVNTSWQIEAQIRSIRGYSLEVQKQENTPGGSLLVRHEVSGLFLGEFPVGVHYRYRSEQAFFVGLRPSWNKPLRPTTTVSSNTVFTGQRSVRQVLRSFDVGVSAGWEWRLHAQWAFDARLTQGIVSLTADGAGDSPHRLYNTDVQISLRYFTTPDKRALIARL